MVRTVATSGAGISELMEAVGGVLQEAGREATDSFCGFVAAGLSAGSSWGRGQEYCVRARSFYEALGLVVSSEETVEHEKVRLAMLPLGESRIELLEPTEAEFGDWEVFGETR